MDVSKYMKKKNLWVFEETFNSFYEKKNNPIGAFVEAKIWKTNGGKDTDVFVLAIEGEDYMIMPFNVDYTSFVEEYGSDTDKWTGKQFMLKKNVKNKYVMQPIEEVI